MADSREVKSAISCSIEKSTKDDLDSILGRFGKTQVLVPVDVVRQLKLLLRESNPAKIVMLQCPAGRRRRRPC